MRYRWSALLAILSIQTLLAIQAAPVMADTALATAQQLRDRAINSSRGWEIVESLTTEVGPRLAGTEADARAVQWAQTLLQVATAEQAGFDKVWLEPVTFPLWLRHHEHARVIAPFPQPLQITALGYSGSTSGEISAEVVGFADLAALERAAPATVTGKIVFINQAMRRHREGLGYGEVVPLRYAAGSVAQSKGAVAVLIRSIGTDSHRFPHTGATARSDNPLPAAALSVPDADQLQRILDRKVNLELALDIKVSEQPGGRSWNVIAQLNGREQPEQIVLIGAHLDSWDLATGAVDDGAGVAIVTAAAELISQLPQRPRSSIRLVLFANEEQGIWGAKAYAQQHAEELENHRFASESDFGAGPVWRFDSSNQSLLDSAMTVLAPLAIERGGAASRAGPDITPLLEQGVAVFSLRQDGSDYFDYHHTADDTLDKINPANLQQNIAAWVVVTYLAAELENGQRHD